MKADIPQEYTIDELAAVSRIPSRTIRFYQTSGALSRPEIRGRVAYYSDKHLERLKLVADLQDRGLRMKAISQLLRQVDKGEVDLREWLGLEAQIGAPWLEDRARVMSKDELLELMGEERPGVLADLLRLRLVERSNHGFFVRSPGLLRIAVQLQSSGIDLDTAYESAALMRKHAARAAKELVRHFFKRASMGFGHDASADEIVEAVRAVRPLGQDALRLIFGQEMEKVLRDLASAGASGIIPDARTKKKR